MFVGFLGYNHSSEWSKLSNERHMNVIPLLQHFKTLLKFMACLQGESFLQHALHKYKNFTLVEIWNVSSSSFIPTKIHKFINLEESYVCLTCPTHLRLRLRNDDGH